MNLNHYLYDHLSANTIHLYLDNDETGRKVSTFLSDKLSNAYKILDEPLSKGKDFDECLCYLKNVAFVVEISIVASNEFG